MNESLAEELL